MGVIITATCGDKSIDIECRRPNWQSMSEAYEKINTLSISKRYELVGGTPLTLYRANPRGYGNTCAMQISYIFNQNGIFLERYISNDKAKQPMGIKDDSILKGADGHNYVVRVKTMVKVLMLKDFFGNADKPYSPKQMNSKQENIKFYKNEFSKFGKKGIVAMQVEGWGDAWGHITLWNGEKFLDDNESGDKNYLIKVDGLDRWGRQVPIIVNLYFWELI